MNLILKTLCLTFVLALPATAQRPEWVRRETSPQHRGGGWSWTVRTDPAVSPQAALSRVELLAVAGLQNEIARRRGDLPGDLSIIDSLDDRWIADRYVGEIELDGQTMHEAAWRLHLDESDLKVVQSRVDDGLRRERVRGLGSVAAVGLLVSAIAASGLNWVARRRTTNRLNHETH